MRFGVIGTNFISREFVCSGSALEGFSLTGVYSRAMETAHAFGDAYGAVCFTDPDSFSAWDGMDAVYIASPNAFHAGQAERCLRKGKHVLVEKPACPDRAAFVRLREIARAEGVVLLEAMRPVFTPGFRALRELTGTIGPVRRVSFSYCQYSSRYDAFKRGVVENAFNPALCNGALMDIGVYCVHALTALFGLPESVLATAQRLSNGLDAQGGVLAVYPDKLADLSYSKIADGRRRNEIQGEEATLLIDSVCNPKEILRLGRDGTRRTLYHDPDPEFFGMVHEIAAFLSFAEAAAKGEKPWETYNLITEQTLSVTDEIRRQTGIDFVPWRERMEEAP